MATESKRSKLQTAPQLDYDQPETGAIVFRLSGPWTISGVIPASEESIQFLAVTEALQRIAFDTTRLEDWDTALLAFLKEIADYCQVNQIKVDASGLPDGVKGLLSLAEAVPRRELVHQKDASLLEMIGRDALDFVTNTGQVVAFFGDVLKALGRFIIGHAKIRRKDLFYNIQEAGLRSVPIISLISFLVGIILAYISAAQLETFGAKIYVASLVGIAMAREMAPIMTAIIIAGRTGAAFAAQLGTMTVNEEIDAYKTLGVPPMEILVLPRVLALTLMMPFLVVYSNLWGNLGGALIAVGQFDISVAEYFSTLQQDIKVMDFFEGLIKSIVYGVLVATSGCLRGIHSGRSAGAVGLATTGAVVMSLVLIVSASAVMTPIFDALR
jgi:phospholipid/cholesterol/gamma-HCH transport system permease protein